MKIRILFFLITVICAPNLLSGQITYSGGMPGQALIKATQGKQVIIENDVIRMSFTNNGKKIVINKFEDKKTGEQLSLDNLPIFEIILSDSSIISSNDFILTKTQGISEAKNSLNSNGLTEKGKIYSADLENEKTGLNVHWEAELLNGSNYVRQIFKFSGNDSLKISMIVLLKLPAGIGIRKEGSVEGSPIVHNNMFFALEYPLSKVEQNKSFLISYLSRMMPTMSTVWGTTPVNQLRRGFLYYVERERAHPYHQLLHYNSWFDISWSDRKFTENECLDRIKVFGDSLINKRHVKMDGFLFDDGWDDNKTLWQFHSGFPDGFRNVAKAAESYNAEPGAWLSPFGGYGKAKMSRLEYGRNQIPPFETNDRGFSLSGPIYYTRFRETTANFIRNFNICMFKFDGVGAGSGAGIVYQKDVEAFLRLLTDLMKIKPDLYLSLTTGTWPSVYWLKFGDNIWRGGDDTNMMGKGSKRQQWITYRDAQTYKNVVLRGPLYPISSLMLHGICIADNGNVRTFGMDEKDISDEVWSFFATGTNLQELYINPHKLSTASWNCLAAASKWAKINESVMPDVHWVGGDPGKEEVYGFAAWTPTRAFLSLRNPSDVEKTFEVNVAKVLDLPSKTPDTYSFYDATTASNPGQQKEIKRGSSFSITLKPFQVIVLNATH